MQGRFRIRAIDVLVGGGLLALFVGMGYQRMQSRRTTEASPNSDDATFVDQVDLSPLNRVAVHADGRLRSFSSHAAYFMNFVTGPRLIDGQSDAFTYLDLMFRPDRYLGQDIIFVKNRLVLKQVLDAIEPADAVPADRRARMMDTRLISQKLLRRPEVVAVLNRLGADLIKTAKPVQAIRSALAVARPDVLSQNLTVMEMPGTGAERPWVPLTTLSGMERGGQHTADQVATALGITPAQAEALSKAWTGLRDAWQTSDATAVNMYVSELADWLPKTFPDHYPSARRLAWEAWYFENGSMTWVWLLYLASVVPLLIAVINKWDGARKVGLAVFLIAFALHTISIGLRWYISGRWPNANMFEAVTTSAWFGGVLAVVLEIVGGRTALRNVFALGSAVVSMAALMAADFLPAQLDSSIGNIMPALQDVWLYIHTNVIIWSYAIIGLAAVTALLFLRRRWCQLWDERLVPRWRLLITPVALAALHVSGYDVLMAIIHRFNNEAVAWQETVTARFLTTAHILPGGASDPLAAKIVLGVFGVSVVWVLFELLEAWGRSKAGRTVDRGVVPSGSALLAGAGGASARSPFLAKVAPTASQVFDAATMVSMELAFIMLWAGIVMGAIWADHSWGRPWGWDPKEVFALNTFIIFLILVHVRMKVRDKGFWTAVLAVFGFETMMFNWIVINFVVTGLHSYA